MRGVNVLVRGGEHVARAMAKQGTASDVTLYNHLAGETALTLVVPSRYPERFQSLLTALALSDAAILVVKELDASLGETILALDCAYVEHGYLLLQGDITRARLEPLLKDTVVSNYTLINDFEPLEVRQRLLALKVPPVPGDTLVDVDACFQVKGIGTVVLGVVRRGTLTKGQQLQLYPGKRLVQIRSIQIHDVDVKEAATGCRVGLAVKNAEVDHFERGSVLAVPHSQDVVDQLSLQVELLPYFKEGYEQGMVFHVGAGLQLVPARVTTSDVSEGKATLSLELEKPLVLQEDRKLMLGYLNARGPRIAGRVMSWTQA